MSNPALITLADALRARRSQLGTRWRRLSVGRQALLVLAHLRKGLPVVSSKEPTFRLVKVV
jgi:hypothetical protein